MLTHTRARGIYGHERPPRRRAIRQDGLQHEELVAPETVIFDRGDDIANDTGEMHGASGLDVNVVDDANNGRIDGTVFQA